MITSSCYVLLHGFNPKCNTCCHRMSSRYTGFTTRPYIRSQTMAQKQYTHLSFEERRILPTTGDMDTLCAGLLKSLIAHLRLFLGNSGDMLQIAERIAQSGHDTKQFKYANIRDVHLKNDTIRSYVIETIRRGWSPEQISGRISRDLPGHSISHEAIRSVHTFLPGYLGVQYICVASGLSVNAHLM